MSRATKPSTYFYSGLFLALVLGASGCRVRQPTMAETAALQQMGAFPGGNPAWASSGRAPTGNTSWGMVPQSYAPASAPRRDTRSREEQVNDLPPVLRRSMIENPVAKRMQEEAEKSPLDRILKNCPGVESEITSALTTVDVKERIKKYTRLNARCPNSPDLWIWLGKDYMKVNRLVDATRCFETAQVLDQGNKEAGDLLSAARKLQTSTPAPAAKDF